MFISRRRPTAAIGFLIAALSFGWAGASNDDSPQQSEPNRVVLMKSDGLPPHLLAAVALPERTDLLDRLSYGEDLRRAIREYQQQTGRQIILPNIRKHFFEDGVVFDNMFAATMTLSAVSWGVIESGQHSVIKGHGTFSRDTCFLRSHLDGFRDSMDQLRLRAPYGEMKTAALWNLDQTGVSLISDAYDPLRVWMGPHIYRRTANRELLLEAGKRWLTADGEGFTDIVHSHLSRLVTGIDYTVFNQEMSGIMTARKILEKDLKGRERFDFISPLLTIMDHQQHVDPHPRNLIHWLVELDHVMGGVFAAVSQSERRDRTIVVLTSDHGSEIKPGKVGFSYPMTRHFRQPIFGGHTVKTLLVESAWKALSTPVPGIDFPRIYESPHSPYGKKRNPEFGQDEYVTCFIDPFGNGRATVYLRNNDINRLHLILLELKREQPTQRFEQLARLFQENLERTRIWLDPDLALLEDYYAGASDLAANLKAKADKFSHDTAWRLSKEVKQLGPQIEALQRLVSITFEEGQGGLNFRRTFSRPFEISHFIPKQYLGQRNSVHQLSNYTLGLDEDLNWIETTIDHKGRSVPMNYFDILANYEAANAPANGKRNPYDLTVTGLPLLEAQRALEQHGLLSGEQLKAAVYMRSSARLNPTKGGEAVAAWTEDDRMLFAPVANFGQSIDGLLHFDLASDRDPLGLLKGPGFRPPAGASPLEWMRHPRPSRDWLKAAFSTEYGTAVNRILDIFYNPTAQFIDSEDFRKYWIYFSSDELKQRYMRGLKRKYAAQAPDFIVWAEELWNFNSKARTSGGNHASLRPIVSRTAFLLWGGNETNLARGRFISDVYTSLDVAPTLLRAARMLDENNHVIPRPGAIPERIFHPLPGRVADIWQGEAPPKIEEER